MKKTVFATAIAVAALTGCVNVPENIAHVEQEGMRQSYVQLLNKASRPFAEVTIIGRDDLQRASQASTPTVFVEVYLQTEKTDDSKRMCNDFSTQADENRFDEKLKEATGGDFSRSLIFYPSMTAASQQPPCSAPYKAAIQAFQNGYSNVKFSADAPSKTPASHVRVIW
ncbi:hypothetical protein ACIPLR_25635 [Herbaspirillum huttiense]|uniref:hypothetical protein n=1 Tax=Herbaspirillum huttiense TaxID=863372 RepID=UPI00380AD7B6